MFNQGCGVVSLTSLQDNGTLRTAEEIQKITKAQSEFNDGLYERYGTEVLKRMRE